MTTNDNFSYRDPNGKRKPRTWVLAVAVIVIILLAVVGLSVYNASARQARIEATPRSVTGPTFTPTAVPPTASATSADASTNCPTDSADWNLVDVWENNTHKRIDPPCVYQGLNKPIAWLLAAQGTGYSNQMAFDKLGFTTDLPYDNSQNLIDVLPALVSDKPIAVTTNWFPQNKDFQDWYVVNNSVVSDTFTLTGCYRTFSMVGNQNKYWSTQYSTSGYTVICEAERDRLAGWDVSELNGNVYSVQIASGKRSVAYFAYDNRPEYHSWYYLGYGDTIDVKPSDMSTMQADAQQELNSPVWNLDWLEKTYGFSVIPLPADWQKHTSKADMDAILAILNK